jgi:hypothetical protein
MRRVVTRAPRPGPLVVASDLYDATWREGAASAAGAGFDVTIVHVLSPEEVRPSLTGDLRLVDEETGDVVDASIDGDTLAQYAEALAAWQADNARWCAARSIAYLPVQSDRPVGPFVLNELRRSGVVAPTTGR